MAIHVKGEESKQSQMTNEAKRHEDLGIGILESSTYNLYFLLKGPASRVTKENPKVSL